MHPFRQELIHMPSLNRQTIETIGLFFCSLLLFTWGLSSQEIISFDSRFYLFAQEMQRYGLTWFPLTYHQPYPDYSAASTVLIHLVASLAGGLTKLTAVFPSAVMAALTVTVTYMIGALRSPRWGLSAALFMILTLTFLKSARGISLDMYTTLITACCFYLLYSAQVKNKSPAMLWIYCLLVISFIFRGPIGLVMPAGVVCLYFLQERQFKKLFIFGVLAVLLLTVCSALFLALAHHVGGESFMQAVLRMQVLGRMDNYYLPRYFYFQDSMGIYAFSFPLSLLVMGGVIYYALTGRHATPDRKLLLQLTGWMLVILIGMSIPDDKKIRYILPMVPAAALIAAYPFVAASQETYFVYLRWLWRRLFLLLPLILLVATVVVSAYAKRHALQFNLHYGHIIRFLACMQFLSLMIFCTQTKRKALRDNLVLFIAALSFTVSNLSIIEPIELQVDKAHAFVSKVENERLAAQAQLIFYKERPDGLPIKYLINMPKAEQPGFIADTKQLMAIPGPAYFVASESYFTDLPKTVAASFHVIARDTLGHVKVVVFKRSV